MKKLILSLVTMTCMSLCTLSAQNTLRFDGEGYLDNANLGHPYQITKNSVTFNFTNSNGDDVLYESSGGFCVNGYPNSLLVGAYGASTIWTIEIDDGSEIDLTSIDFANQYTTCFPFTYNLSVEGFKNNVSTGTAVALSVGTASHITTFNANSNFDEVDKIVITATASVLGALGIEEIVWSSAAADPVVTLTVSNNNPSEGDGSVTLTATSDVAPSADLTVNLSYSGTASGSGTDYTAVSSIVIASGTTSNTGTLNITSDNDVESDETIIIDIDSFSGGTATEGSPNQQTVTIANDDYEFSIKVFLEGPLSGSAMSTVISGAVPKDPNDVYSGVQAEDAVASLPANTVDWVEVEIRTGTSAATKVGTNRAAILKADGSVVDKDGNAFTLSQADGTSYYIVIHHRNHLSVMSKDPVVASSGTYTMDFTAAGVSHGTGGDISINGEYAMIAGDADGNGTVNGDDLIAWRGENGKAFSYSSSGNDKMDLNLDGVINAVDRNEFQQKNSVTTTQVPNT